MEKSPNRGHTASNGITALTGQRCQVYNSLSTGECSLCALSMSSPAKTRSLCETAKLRWPMSRRAGCRSIPSRNHHRANVLANLLGSPGITPACSPRHRYAKCKSRALRARGVGSSSSLKGAR